MAAAVTLFRWLTIEPAVDLFVYVPGLDGVPQTDAAGASGDGGAGAAGQDPVSIGEFFERFDGVPGSTPGAWPGFRGADHTNVTASSSDFVGRLDPAEPPPVLWNIDLGEGHAGAAVDDGRVYVLDYDEERSGDSLRCFSLDDGEEIWRRWYRVHIKRNHGISRTIPAVADGYVVTMGPECHVMCVRADTGDLLWSIDCARELGTEVPLWYTGQCPIIDDGVAVIAPGGDALMIGVDCETGEIVWRTDNPDGYAMSHSSVIPMELAGARVYVYAAVGGIVGVSAERESRGTVLWRSTDFDAAVIAPSPVRVGPNRVFQTAGYGAGSIMLEIVSGEDGFEARTVYARRPGETLSCEQQTPLFVNGYLYGILPKDAGPLRNQFVCFDPDGSVVWSSGETARFGLGPFMIVDDVFLILSDTGVLSTAQVHSGAFVPLGSVQLLSGRDSWAPMAFVGGRLIARDSQTMVCVDLGAAGSGATLSLIHI